MKDIHVCRIIGQSEVAPRIVRALLKGPKIAREAQPGQFVNVQVGKTTDPLLRRPFSVHAAYPDEGVYSILYAVRGRGTTLLSEMRPGDELSVIGPLGTPFDLGESSDSRHILVAGGCGAAPLHFLCDALCRKWGCDNVTVLAGAQSKDAVVCEAEFRANGVNVIVSTDDGSHGFHGLATQLLETHLSKCISQTPGSHVRVYSCGPHMMLKQVAQICREAGVARCQVSLETVMACGVGVCLGCVQKVRGDSGTSYKRVCVDGPVFDAEEIVWD
ncbi:MAG: dihydroorotate dehydrogenase electron transfer subunit [Armatimonadetes bacterium]|nr:dihydroorotate dehydrogenase electron transfer subunit [Armatimonadota bacterium]